MLGRRSLSRQSGGLERDRLGHRDVPDATLRWDLRQSAIGRVDSASSRSNQRPGLSVTVDHLGVRRARWNRKEQVQPDARKHTSGEELRPAGTSPGAEEGTQDRVGGQLPVNGMRSRIAATLGVTAILVAACSSGATPSLGELGRAERSGPERSSPVRRGAVGRGQPGRRRRPEDGDDRGRGRRRRRRLRRRQDRGSGQHHRDPAGLGELRPDHHRLLGEVRDQGPVGQARRRTARTRSTRPRSSPAPGASPTSSTSGRRRRGPHRHVRPVPGGHLGGHP